MMRLLWLFCCTLWLYGGEYVVIVNASSPIEKLTAPQIKKIFLKRKRYWQELPLSPVNLPPQNSVRMTFESQVLHMEREGLNRYWVKQHYKGRRPPYVFQSPRSVLRFVQKVKGAVGYVPKELADKRVKVVYGFSS